MTIQSRQSGHEKPSTLLTLPKHVRRRIYDAVGLLSSHFIYLKHKDVVEPVNSNWERLRTRRPSSDLDHERSGAPHRIMPCSNLAKCCRLLYSEISQITYAENQIVIWFNDVPLGLQTLRDIRPNNIAHLSHLIIRLRMSRSKCVELWHRHLPWDEQSCCLIDETLGSISADDQAMMDEWEDTIRYLAQHVTPNRLTLELTCDAKSIKAAQRVAHAVTSLPTLKNCAIRFGEYPSSGVYQRLAMETVLRATGRWSENRACSPFRFGDLPDIIRHRILEQTDLVTPLAEIEWSWRHSDIHKARYKTTWHREGNPIKSCSIYRLAGEVCCSRLATAYSTICHCWKPPTSIFLVSKAMRREALRVFFGNNHFVLTPFRYLERVPTNTHHYEGDDHDYWIEQPLLWYLPNVPENRVLKWSDPPNELAASIFLTKVIPLDALQFLRSLEIVFPPITLDYVLMGDETLESWVRALRHIASHARLPSLTITIIMAGLPLLNLGWPSCKDIEWTVPDSAFEEGGDSTTPNIINTRMLLLKPLKILAGIKDIFIHFPWPEQTNFTRLAKPGSKRIAFQYHEFNNDEKIETRRTLIRQVQQRLEKNVMGEAYDSTARGKYTRKPSGWREACQKGLIPKPRTLSRHERRISN